MRKKKPASKDQLPSIGKILMMMRRPPGYGLLIVSLWFVELVHAPYDLVGGSLQEAMSVSVI